MYVWTIAEMGFSIEKIQLKCLILFFFTIFIEFETDERWTACNNMICDYDPCVNDDDFTMWENKRLFILLNRRMDDSPVKCSQRWWLLLYMYTDDVCAFWKFQTSFCFRHGSMFTQCDFNSFFSSDFDWNFGQKELWLKEKIGWKMVETIMHNARCIIQTLKRKNTCERMKMKYIHRK